MRKKEKAVRWLGRHGLPEDALCDTARVTLTGRTLVCIQGQHGVVELSSMRIRLKTGGGILCVSGENLALKTLDAQTAFISGDRLDAVSYA